MTRAKKADSDDLLVCRRRVFVRARRVLPVAAAEVSIDDVRRRAAHAAQQRRAARRASRMSGPPHRCSACNADSTGAGRYGRGKKPILRLDHYADYRSKTLGQLCADCARAILRVLSERGAQALVSEYDRVKEWPEEQ